jgi:RNA polymerase sigma-70 factor (ECF subfamily)
MRLEEETLPEEAHADGRASFPTLVERHSRYLFRVAYRMTGNEQDAEDMVQEAFLRAHRRFGSYDGQAEVRTWLTRIAVNCCLDLLRSRGRRGIPVPLEENLAVWTSEPSPEQRMFSEEIRRHLGAALSRLTAAERAAFVLRHYEGAPVEEIARALGKPAGATRHCVFRAVQKLREALAPLAAAARASGEAGI